MKELILVRHAKSSWADASLADRERPLNPRGRRDAPLMAERLAESGAVVDRLLTSPARRTRMTAQAFVEAFRLEEEDLRLEPQLYGAGEDDWLEVIGRQPGQVQSLLMVGHNPGLTGFLNDFLDDPVANVPTCGIARLQFDLEAWNEIEEAEPLKVLYAIPKSSDWQELS
jgi:phosphohistidine phosphatase